MSQSVITDFTRSLRTDGLQVTSMNRVLEVLRRMLRLAVEWGELAKAPPKVEMLPGENERDRVLTREEEDRYLAATARVGAQIERAYGAALQGLRAKKGKAPHKPEDPYLLRDAAPILVDCALRPEECFRLRWRNVRDGSLVVPFGKTENARRAVPQTPRVAALLEMRRGGTADSEWVFPAGTRSGHIEKSSLKKQHRKALSMSKVEPFTLYT